ncbi:Hypothetical predicted protein [Marmota monax]|uniref:Uncharacterized protein n=1 Tax=Marmota monax TaxID=9995 RepID=A0A5E4BGD9_MARMO|nr:Hypothetical predicted protein [Marmota monax]
MKKRPPTDLSPDSGRRDINSTQPRTNVTLNMTAVRTVVHKTFTLVLQRGKSSGPLTYGPLQSVETWSVVVVVEGLLLSRESKCWTTVGHRVTRRENLVPG